MFPLNYSDENKVQEYRQIPKHEPYDVFYQTHVCESFNQSGLNFNITPPGPTAALSTDIWVEYTFYIRETANEFIRNMFDDANGLIEAGEPSVAPANPIKIALRQGNVMAKSMTSLVITINQMEFKYNPIDYIDVLNRLFVSNTQSTHEFAASGGAFSSGNHGFRTDNIRYHEYGNNAVINGWALLNGAHPNNTRIQGNVYKGFVPNQDPATINFGNDFWFNLRSDYPLNYQFYNPGYSERFKKFAYKIRNEWNQAANMTVTWPKGSIVQPLPPYTPSQFTSEVVDPDVIPGIAPDQNFWTVVLYERLPVPMFKMYSNDTNNGVIGNIKDLRIRADFLQGDRLFQNIFTSQTQNANMEVDFYQSLTFDRHKFSARLVVKWFIPTTPLPKQIFVNCPIIDVWTYNFSQSAGNANAVAAAATTKYVDTEVNVRDISLRAVPDILLVYVKYQSRRIVLNNPDDYHLELNNFAMTMNASSCKIFGINSYYYYQLWKRNLQYQDHQIIDFEEWRKYCFVAVLKPEDYGLRKNKEEANHPIYVSIRCTARNWWINPTIWQAPAETMGGINGNGTNLQLTVTSIYSRNEITLDTTDRSTFRLKPL